MTRHFIANVNRFVNCEKWRATMGPNGLDDLTRTFDYKEKEQVFQYYPQYYHKTDKVSLIAKYQNTS